jgi:hypothetical protein
MRNWIVKPFAFILSTLAMLDAAWARNPWASAVGEACVVQHRAEDIANRIKRTAPHSHLVRHAMAMDHLACTLVERVKCGAPCNQVEALYEQLEGSWRQLRLAIYTDPCLCADRTLKSLSDSMDTRMRNLCKALERVIEREFRCAPRINFPIPQAYGSHSTYGYPGNFGSSSSTLNLQFQSSNRIPFGVPSNSIHFGVPSISLGHQGYPNPIPYGPTWNQPTWPNPAFGGSGPWRAF